MGFEAYNQLIKNLALMSNFKNPLFSVARFWIAKTSLSLLKGSAASFSAGEVCISSETSDLASLTETNEMARCCVADSPGALEVRHVCSFTREGDRVLVGSWLLVDVVRNDYLGPTEHAPPSLVQVQELMEIATPTDGRLYLRGMFRDCPAADSERGGSLISGINQWSNLIETHNIVLVSEIRFTVVHVSIAGDGSEYTIQEVH